MMKYLLQFRSKKGKKKYYNILIAQENIYAPERRIVGPCIDNLCKF